MTHYHVAGPTDARCEVRCVRCGCLLAPAHVWQHSETGAEMRSPLGLRPSEGDIVAMTGEGPYFGQFRADPRTAPTCAVSAMKGAA